MEIRTTLTVILAFAALGIFTDSASAKEVSIKSQSSVQKSCQGDGDVYWIPGGTGHTYGCMHGDGSGIVCSGVTAKQKKTCSTFRTTSSPVPKLPTRDDAMKAEQ